MKQLLMLAVIAIVFTAGWIVAQDDSWQGEKYEYSILTIGKNLMQFEAPDKKAWKYNTGDPEALLKDFLAKLDYPVEQRKECSKWGPHLLNFLGSQGWHVVHTELVQPEQAVSVAYVPKLVRYYLERRVQ